MTYQERLNELTDIWREKALAFYKVNKDVLAMDGNNVPPIDRESPESLELEKAQLNIKAFETMMKQNNINPYSEMV